MYVCIMLVISCIGIVYSFFGLPEYIYVPLISTALVSFFVITLIMTRGFMLYVSLAAFFCGHIMLCYFKTGFDVWFKSISVGASLPALFCVIPLLSIQLKNGEFVQSIERISSNINRKPVLSFPLLVVINHFLCTAANIGGIFIMSGILKKTSLSKEYRLRVYTAAYSCYMLLAPFDGLIQMWLKLARTTFGIYWPYGVAGCLIVISVSTLLIIIKGEKAPLLENFVSFNDIFVIAKFFSNILLITALIIFCHLTIPAGDRIHISAVVIGVYGLVWLTLTGKVNFILRKPDVYINELLLFKSVLPFLLALAFLGTVFSHTPLQNILSGYLTSMNSLPLYIQLVLLSALTTICALVGIHMMIPVSAIAFTFSAESFGISPPLFALVLLSSWFIAMSSSPFSPFTAVAARCSEMSPLKASLRHNIFFGIVMLLVFPCLISLINYCF